MVNGPFVPPVGRIAVDLYDFRKHIDGTSFRHSADQIDNSPGVGGATDVQGSINNINAFIASLADNGTAFSAIPDGYNSYTNPAPNFYFSNTVPPLSDFLIPLFAAIAAGTPMPEGYAKLASGGILYIPAGTYYINQTVSIPPGVILLGEGWATQIINATSLNVAVSPPIVDGLGTPAPVFKILADTGRGQIDDVIDSDNANGTFMFARRVMLFNLTIGDNFVSPTSLGDLNYKLPQNTSGDTPIILQNQGSNLELQNVYLIGRASTSGTAVDFATTYGVKLDTVSPSVGSILKMTTCFLDGFSQPISFHNGSGSSDYLEISDCKIKSYGYLNADATGAGNNCIISINNCNARIVSNNFFGTHDALLSMVYLDDVVSGGVPIQSYSKIIITTNGFTVDRNQTSPLATVPFAINPAALTNAMTSIAPAVFGNSLAAGFEINTSLFVNTNAVSSSYVVDSATLDIVVLADSTSAPLTITLPPHRQGRQITIKDSGGKASVNPITVARESSGKIDDYTGSRLIANDWASMTLMSFGGNWYCI